MKKQSRLDVRKYSFSQRTINVWNKLSTANIRTSEGIIAAPNREPGKELNDPTANYSANFIKSDHIRLHIRQQTSQWDKAKCPKMSHSMQPKRGLYVEHIELPIGHFDQQCCSDRCQLENFS